MGQPLLYKGVSMWGNLAQAEEMARRPGYVAEVAIPQPHPSVRVYKTLGPGHYSVVGPADQLLAFVRRSFSLQLQHGR